MVKNYNDLKLIEESINTFDDTEFISILNDKELIIKNASSENVYKVGYKIVNEDIIIDTREFELVQENEKDINDLNIKDKDVRDSIKKGIKNFLNESNEEPIEQLNELLTNISFSKRKKSEEQIIKESKETIESKYDSFNEDERKVISSIVEKFGKQIAKYDVIFEEFKKNGKLFEDNGDIKEGVFMSPKRIIDLYSEKIKSFSELATGIDEVNTIIDTITEQLDLDEDLVSNIFEGVDFLNKEQYAMDLTKNIVAFKKQYDEDINVSEFLKLAKNLYTENISTDELTGKEFFESYDKKLTNLIEVYSENLNDYKGPVSSLNFLRYNTGLFNQDAVRALKNDFDNVMKRVMSFTEEDLTVINNMRDTIEYMDRTGNINDEQIVKIISLFNERYGKPVTFSLDPKEISSLKDDFSVRGSSAKRPTAELVSDDKQELTVESEKFSNFGKLKSAMAKAKVKMKAQKDKKMKTAQELPSPVDGGKVAGGGKQSKKPSIPGIAEKVKDWKIKTIESENPSKMTGKKGKKPFLTTPKTNRNNKTI